MEQDRLWREYEARLAQAGVSRDAPMAEAARRMHPLRLSYELFGPRNPFLSWVAGAAEQAPVVSLDKVADREDGRALLAAEDDICSGFKADIARPCQQQAGGCG